jgi:hypothetical protein
MFAICPHLWGRGGGDTVSAWAAGPSNRQWVAWTLGPHMTMAYHIEPDIASGDLCVLICKIRIERYCSYKDIVKIKGENVCQLLAA